jgi:hypothetical protein
MKTLILTCSRNDSYCGGYVTGLMQAMTSPHFGGWLKMEHESDIARGRSKLMGQALETKFDSFLWVDDDIVWTRAHFDAICEVPVDCVGGVYAKRNHVRSQVWNWLLGEELESDRNVCTVKEVGTGFLRVTRTAIEAMKGIVPEAPMSGFTHYFAAGVKTDGEYQSEDYAFCRLLWTAGISVWLHRGVRLGHVGNHVYRP